jgi:adenylate cyclase class 2
LYLEQEVKLGYGHVEAARQAVQAAGGRLDVSRRLLDDRLFDTPDGRLRRAGQGLRIRRDGPRTILTVKGPVHAGPVKAREEIEVDVDSAELAEALLRALGYLPCFRGQKYREEYVLDDARIAVDETPMGAFIEIEGSIEAIDRVAALLGRSRSNYVLESYPGLYRAWCETRGIADTDMVFKSPVM